MKRNLLQRNRKVLKGLHELYGFDFESVFSISEHVGKFTLNSIKKELGVADFDGMNVAVLIVDNTWGRNYDYFKAVKATNGGFVISHEKTGMYNYGLDDFYAKTYFEDLRKREGKIYYIVAQEKELSVKPSEKKADLCERFGLVRVHRWSDGRGKHGLSQLTLSDKMHNGKEFSYKTANRLAGESALNYIDKSGYIAEIKREELKRKALKVKAEREKAKADKADYGAEIADFDKAMEEIKAELSKAALSISGYNSVYNFGDILQSMRWAYRGIEKFKARYNEHSFSSVEVANREIKSIAEDIENCKKAIEKFYGNK